MFNPFKKIEKPDMEPRPETREGFVPIRASIIDKDNIDDFTEVIIKNIKQDGIDIDYSADEMIYKENQMKNAGKRTYVISSCDDRNKFSEGYYNCTGIIIAGKDKNGKEISFMSHQDPVKFLGKVKDKFTEDLSERTEEILKKVNKDSIDAIIFGGKGDFEDPFSGIIKEFDKNFDVSPIKGNYEDSIKFISNILKEKLGFEPTVMTGPNMLSGPSNFYLDTQKRHLYIIRPYQENNKTNLDYLPSEIDEMSKKWEKKD